MMTFDQFGFASPPRSGTVWFKKAAHAVGLVSSHANRVHLPPPSSWNGLILASVRNPVSWLSSYYRALEGGVIGVTAVDRLSSLARLSKDLPSFLEMYLEHLPGAVGEMYTAYGHTTAIRLEDEPWAAVNFFESIGISKKLTDRVIPITPQNCTKGLPHAVSSGLKQRVMDAEEDYCERYEY